MNGRVRSIISVNILSIHRFTETQIHMKDIGLTGLTKAALASYSADGVEWPKSFRLRIFVLNLRAMILITPLA